MNKLKNLTNGIISGVLALSILVLPATTFAGFFPADRQTYTCITPTNCPGADHVQFNSFTNNPVVGDERPFFAGSLNGANVQDRIKVTNGQTVVLRAYVHNNADPNKIGAAAAVARNVKIRMMLPTVKQKDQNLVSFITAANATPGTVNDTMSLYADKDFTIEYVPGSAKFDYKPDGTNMTSAKLNDSIVATGASLGDIHGCFQYSGYVTLSVKVKMEETPPVTPPVTPPTTPPTTTPPTPGKTAPTPSALPATGPADVAAVVAAVVFASTIAYYIVNRRLSNRQQARLPQYLWITVQSKSQICAKMQSVLNMSP